MYCKLILPRVLPIYKFAGIKLDEGEMIYQVSATSIKFQNLEIQVIIIQAYNRP